MKSDMAEQSERRDFEKDLALITHIQKHIELNQSDIAYVKSIISVKSFERGDLLLEQGKLCRQLFFVESGSLRAYNLSKNDKEATIMFAVDDWWITDMYCFTNQKPAMLTLEAIEDTKVAILGYEAFEILLKVRPQFEGFFRVLFQKAYAREQLRALDAISLTTEERFHSFVIKYPQIAEKVTQKQIASYLGVTPEFLSSVKKKMK